MPKTIDLSSRMIAGLLAVAFALPCAPFKPPPERGTCPDACAPNMTCAEGRCGCLPSFVDCDGEPENGCESAVEACAECLPESEAAICARHDASCGLLSAVDNCGLGRTADCGECRDGGVECDGGDCSDGGSACEGGECLDGGSECVGGDCGECVPVSDAELCLLHGKACGSLTTADNCGDLRTVTCGAEACPPCDAEAPATCGWSCAAPIELNTQATFTEDGFTYSNTTADGKLGNDDSYYCGGNYAPERVLRLVVPRRMALELTTEGGLTDFDTFLYVRSECGNRRSELACNDRFAGGDAARLVLEDLQPGAVLFIFVDGTGSYSRASKGNFTLTGRFHSPEPCPSSSDRDLCAATGLECRESFAYDPACGRIRKVDCGDCPDYEACGWVEPNKCGVGRKIGSPCTSDDQCEAGEYGNPWCITGAPGGYCNIDQCWSYPSGNWCPSGLCYRHGYCLLWCTTDADCREGYSCMELPPPWAPGNTVCVWPGLLSSY